MLEWIRDLTLVNARCIHMHGLSDAGSRRLDLHLGQGHRTHSLMEEFCRHGCRKGNAECHTECESAAHVLQIIY